MDSTITQHGENTFMVNTDESNNGSFNKLTQIALDKNGLSANNILEIINDIDKYVPCLRHIFFENNINIDFFSVFIKLIKTSNNIILWDNISIIPEKLNINFWEIVFHTFDKINIKR